MKPLIGEMKTVVAWLRKNAKRSEGMTAVRGRAKKAGIKIYPKAWGAAFPKAGTATRRTKKKATPARAPSNGNGARSSLPILINGSSPFDTAIELRAAAADLHDRASSLEQAAVALEAIGS